jgi:hypothetical protein
MPSRELFLRPLFYAVVLALMTAPLSSVNASGAADPAGPGLPTPVTLPNGGSVFSFQAQPDAPGRQPDKQDPHLVASGVGQPPNSPVTATGDDRENFDPTGWAVYEHQTTADVVNTATTNNLRVVDLSLETGTNPYQFTAVYVANTGSYAKTWWFLAAVTPTSLLDFSVNNNARIVVQKAVNDPSPGGSVLFYVVLVANTGADAKSWWFYKDQSIANLTTLWQNNTARLVQVNSYVRSATTYYDAVMISNTGADARTWWWYVNTTPPQLGTYVTNNNARVVDLDYDTATGNYNAIMTSCASGCPAWWWYFGVSTSDLLNTVTQNGARVIDANVRPGCGDQCWDILLIDNSTTTIAGNAGQANVTLSYSNGGAQSVTSDANGYYSLNVPVGWSGSLTPSKAGYQFSPASRTYNNVSSNKLADNFFTFSVPPADFNGDHKADVALFRQSNGTWYVNGQGSYPYGQSGDIPVPADYNGDGKADIAVFRPSNNTWYIFGQGSFVYGQSGDIPVVADYNGDRMADIAVFRPSTSTWYIRGQGSFVYGQSGDIPVVADYNGDGKADIAVFRPSTSTWYIRGQGSFVYGTVGDIPAVADYNGDGKADIAVFRPTTSTWYLYGIGPRVYGAVGDIPVVADYNGDGKADIAVFRPTTSTWYIYGVGPSVYGTVGDIPV